MCALHHPAPRLGSGMTLGPDLLAARAQVQGEAELLSQGARLVVVEALIQAEVLLSRQRCCGRRRVGSGRSIGMASSVSRISLWSLRLAPSMVAPRGTPRPSVSTERFTPRLPRSVGLGPVFPPAQRRLARQDQWS
jgi:hypothetical protein